MTDMMSTTGITYEVDALRSRLAGEIVTPQDREWDVARQAWNLAVDQRPAMVALPETDDDVVAIVDFARERGLRIAPQGTGHNASPFPDLDDTVLLKTSRMTGVDIDPVGQRARVRAGALWADVTAPAGEHGLAALSGSSPDVGVVGYSLGGGLSWLARRYGIGANSVLAIELVTADGRLLRADRDHHADLFWALRGGGGNFGVVTAMEFLLYPISHVYAGAMIWPVERATDVMQAWREWTQDLPDAVTSNIRILNVPPLPDIPEFLRGRSVVIAEAIVTAGEAEGAALVEPLRALGPEIDTCAVIPTSALITLHMDPDHPMPAKGDHQLLSELTPEAIDAIVAVGAPQSGSPLLGMELRHLGGAVARRAAHHGALDAIEAPYATFAFGIPADEAMAAAIEGHLAVVREALAPWDAGREYLNFSERPCSAEGMFEAGTYRRLRDVKARYDAEDLFRANHPIAPAR
jgi:hypothetical protein